PATGGTTNPFFLNGQQWDGAGVWNSGEGLYFNRARYYQAGLGRFLGKDLYSGVNYEPVTLHRYLYGANDSVNNVDPTGNSFIGAIGAAFADLSAVIRDTGRVAIGGASIQHTLRYLAVRGFFWFSSHAIAPLIVEGSVAIGATATANAINWMLDRMANSMLNDGNPDNLFFNEDSEKEHVGGGWKDQGALHEDNFDEGPDDFKNIAKHYDKVDRIVSIGPKNKLFASLGTSWDYSEANLLSKIEAKVRAMSEPQYKIKKDSKHLISDDLPEFQKPQSGDVKAHIHGIPEDGIGILKSRTFIWKLMDLQRQYKVNIRITPIRGWVRGPLR
ncbi:RHS repeat-associated core domain-containing protein, partial [Armatimonas sp.]|uniref:RHS repeat-associated core domain-containing protein n=1 Tax=Armatimonas sp. TaxID=1872638 RepID=UPI00374FEDCA